MRDADGRVQLAVNVIEDVTEVKRAEQAQRLLAQAGQVLASSLDYEETLAQVAHLAIGELADWCGVTLPGERGMLRSVAVAHVDPDKVRFAHELNERFPQRIDEPGGAADVLRTGTSQVVNEISDELLEQSVADPEQLEPIRELGMRAAMIVPMVAGGRTIGVDQLHLGRVAPHVLGRRRRAGRGARAPRGDCGRERAPVHRALAHRRHPPGQPAARPGCPRCPASASPRCTGPRARRTGSAATSTTRSAPARAGWSSSATSPGAAPRRRR